jgi:hypothetical protein
VQVRAEVLAQSVAAMVAQHELQMRRQTGINHRQVAVAVVAVVVRMTPAGFVFAVLALVVFVFAAFVFAAVGLAMTTVIVPAASHPSLSLVST